MTSRLKIVDFGIRTCNGIGLALAAGQCVGLTGPSGVGKTLFLRALADLDPHQGQMWLDGVASHEMSASCWRRQVGMLPAESAWWHATVGPHLLDVPKLDLPQVERAEDFAVQALCDLGFDRNVLGWSISRLSSGERQRLALLRLLMRRPRVLLLDEPTANLDSDNAARVETLIDRHRTAHQPAILWVSHDMDQLQRLCHPVYALDKTQLKQLDLAVPQTREGN